MNKPLLLPLLLILSCASPSHDDPLKNTKKLVKEGHISLYKNGALNVPYTEVKLIAPGPQTFDLATNLIGVKAHDSLLLALSNISKSYGLIKRGTLGSLKLSKNIYNKTTELSNTIHQTSLNDSIYLIKRSSDLPKEAVVTSLKIKDHVVSEMRNLESRIEASSKKFGEEAKRDFLMSGTMTAQELRSDANKNDEKLISFANEFGESMKRESNKSLSFSKEKFIQGWMSFPQKTVDRFKGYSLDEFSKIIKQSNDTRENLNNKVSYLFSGNISEYKDDVNTSLGNAKEALTTKSSSIGLTLGAIRSLTWLTKAILWDATIKPLGKIGGAALGYATVNGIIYPSLVVSKGGQVTSEIAVEVVSDVAGTFYDLTAPTTIAAVSSVFALIERGGGALTKHTLLGYEKVTSSANKVIKEAAAKGVEVSGQLGGNLVSVTANALGSASAATIHYVGIPLTSVGVPVIGGSTGVVLGTTGLAGGVGTLVGGETLAGSSYLFGTTLSTGTAIGGTALSVGAASGLALYESAKGIAVPSAYTMGSGIVLTYGNLTQLGAQTIYAATDAAYLVLSLEGPRWVLYAVKGKLGDGNDLSSGTILNLNEMKKHGEVFHAIPISEDEVKGVVESLSK